MLKLLSAVLELAVALSVNVLVVEAETSVGSSWCRFGAARR